MNIEPMLLTETFDKAIIKDRSKIFQTKENGVRAIVHVKDSCVVGIRNRANNPILYLFPELRNTKLNISNGILDGEICVMKNNKSVFYGGIDKRRSIPDAHTLKEYPATLMVFDALYLNNENLIMKPYEYRWQRVTEQLESNDVVKTVFSTNEGEMLWDDIIKDNREGIVVKYPNAIYEIGKRSKQYIKIKNYKIVEMIVEKTEANSKGTKCYGKVKIEDRELDVEVQLGGIFGIENGTINIKYLDIAGNRLIQGTKCNQEQIANI